jgi:hypothetical protein
LEEAKLLSGTVKVTLIFLRAQTPYICLVAGLEEASETVNENKVRLELILYKNLTVLNR